MNEDDYIKAAYRLNDWMAKGQKVVIKPEAMAAALRDAFRAGQVAGRAERPSTVSAKDLLDSVFRR
jgi:hypothetical protein